MSRARPAFVFHGTNVLKRAICFYLNNRVLRVRGKQKCQRLANRIYFSMGPVDSRAVLHILQLYNMN